MAFFRRSLAQRVLGLSRIQNPASITTCRTSLPRTAVGLNNHNTPSKLAPDPGDDGVFRRYLHRHSAASAVGLLPAVGNTLLEKLRGIDITKKRIKLDGLIPPAAATDEGEVTVAEVKKILRLAHMEKVKSRLRQIKGGCVSYTNFLEICAEECSNRDLGLEFAKILDESGAVIVIGNNVFLQPHQEK